LTVSRRICDYSWPFIEEKGADLSQQMKVKTRRDEPRCIHHGQNADQGGERRYHRCGEESSSTSFLILIFITQLTLHIMSNLQASNLFSVQDRVAVITGGGSGKQEDPSA
jgi:hypothetical protein